MTKHYKIAVPIVADNQRDIIGKAADAIKRTADLVEYRLDLVNGNFNTHSLWELSHSKRIPKIYTNRPKVQPQIVGIKDNYEERERVGLLRQIAIAHDPDYIDLEHELTKYRGFKPIRKEGKTKIIVSHHDFNQTPDYDGLRRLYDEIAGRADCDIVKIATKVNNEKDNDNILKLIEHASKGGGAKPIVSVGMGKLGKRTRYQGPEAGSLWTFGALSEDNRSAPGQPLIEDLRHYWKTGEMR